MQLEYENIVFPLTIFSLGTDQKRDVKSDTILHRFINSCQSSKLVIDGPSVVGIDVFSIGQEACNLILEKLQHETINQSPLIINLTGFSRGGIVNLYIVNFIYEHLEKLEKKLNRPLSENHVLYNLKRLQVNMFNLDPVAGIGASSHPFARNIPKIVNKYVALLQLDEMRREFKPQDLTRIIVQSSKDTDVCLLPLYGNHSNATKIKSYERCSAPVIYQSMLYFFLTKHHSQFTFFPPTSSPHELLASYSKHHQERQSYFQYGKRMKFFDSSMFRTPRKINKQIKYYIDDPDIFVNLCEKELLKFCYPNAFHVLFEHNINAIDVRLATNECKIIQEKFPELWIRLCMHLPNIHDKDEQIEINAASGFHHEFPFHILPMLFNDISKIKIENDLGRLVADVRRLTFRYEREKSDLFTFHRRPLAHAAQAIRDQVDVICSENEKDNTYANIITMLQDISLDFKQAHHNNDLMLMIDELLLSYDESIPLINTSNFDIQIYLIKFMMDGMYYMVDFIGKLGYIPGFILSLTGIFFNDMGTRLLDVSFPEIFLWPLIPFAFCIQQLGILLKSHFGLKGVIEDLEYEIIVARDNWIRDLTIKREEEPEFDSSRLLHG